MKAILITAGAALLSIWFAVWRSRPQVREIEAPKPPEFVDQGLRKGTSSPSVESYYDFEELNLSKNATEEIIKWLDDFESKVTAFAPDTRAGYGGRLSYEIYKHFGPEGVQKFLIDSAFFDRASKLSAGKDSNLYVQLCRQIIENRPLNTPLEDLKPLGISKDIAIVWEAEIAKTRFAIEKESIIENLRKLTPDVRAIVEIEALSELAAFRPKYGLETFLNNSEPWIGNNGRLQQIYQDWVSEHAYETSVVLTTSPASPRKDQITTILIDAIRKSDPKAAMAWIESISDAELKQLKRSQMQDIR